MNWSQPQPRNTTHPMIGQPLVEQSLPGHEGDSTFGYFQEGLMLGDPAGRTPSACPQLHSPSPDLLDVVLAGIRPHPHDLIQRRVHRRPTTPWPVPVHAVEEHAAFLSVGPQSVHPRPCRDRSDQRKQEHRLERVGMGGGNPLSPTITFMAINPPSWRDQAAFPSYPRKNIPRGMKERA
jgi:hypothetical protein